MRCFKFYLYILIFCLSACTINHDYKENISQNKIEEIYKKIKEIENIDSTNYREKLKDSLLLVSNLIKNDSQRNKAYSLVLYFFLQNNDSLRFQDLQKKVVALSEKLRDSQKIGRTYEYLAYFYNNHLLDSSYYYYNKAEKIYHLTNSEISQGRVLLNMAIIQKNIKDYTGSEITTIRALQIFEKHKQFLQSFSAYNNLGIIYDEFDEYEKAIKYYQKANKRLKTTDQFDKSQSLILNNIGVTYQNMGNYEESISKFQQGLNIPNLSKTNPKRFAMLLDNLAFSLFLINKLENVEKFSKRALRIRDSIHHTDGIIISRIHLANYFLKKGDTSNAIKNLANSYKLSIKTNNYRDLLVSLRQLSEIDHKNGTKYSKEYIRINDSLQNEERATRNKFARIRYETDQFIAQNNSLSKQRKWLVIGFSILLIIGILIYIIRNQHVKNRELKLIQAQQAANEEIYNLMMTSQSKLEEGQIKEKKRISKELHDGILSKFFGVRLNLEFLNSSDDSAAVEQRQKYLKELKSLEVEIRDVSHKLSMDFSSSENSFFEILIGLIEEQEKIGRFIATTSFDKSLKWERITNKVKINFYRIVQEALHNITKYAEAKKVDVEFKVQNKIIYLIIADNGKGFDVKNSSEGIGLVNMKSRSSDINGNFKVVSDTSGTTLTIAIPIDKLY